MPHNVLLEPSLAGM